MIKQNESNKFKPKTNGNSEKPKRFSDFKGQTSHAKPRPTNPKTRTGQDSPKPRGNQEFKRKPYPSQSRGSESKPVSADGKTSWQNVSGWYNDAVGEDGHYYHQHVIIPGVTRLLKLQKGHSLLDLACGQGILERHLPSQIDYMGIDISPAMIRVAAQYVEESRHVFQVGDLTKQMTFPRTYTHAAIILALQNISRPQLALKNAAQGLVKGGQLIIVLNHPCYRVPRQTSWKIDEEQKIQYRRVDRYMSSMEIPIQMNPGAGAKSEQTFSYHHPLSSYFLMLQETGFVVEGMEEWCSNKESTGKAAKMENRARSEFPLFLTLICRKL